MKKMIMCSILVTLVGMLCACGENTKDVCSISGCKNQVYKDGLCPDHYIAVQTADKVEEHSDSIGVDTNDSTRIQENKIEEKMINSTGKIGLRNMKEDSSEWELSSDQRLIVRYFDNDYFSTDYSSFRKYPDLFDRVQVESVAVIMKVLNQDANNYQLLASWQHCYDEQYSDYISGAFAESLDPMEELVVLKGKTVDQYYMEKENVYLKGRCTGIESIEVDGKTYLLPVIETYTLNEKFSYEEIKTIAEMIFGNQITVSKEMYTPNDELVEFIGDEPIPTGRYEIKLDNQKNAKFDSYLMSETGNLFIEDNEEGSNIKRNIEFASDFMHFFLFSYDNSVNNLTLEYYDKDLNLVWKKEYLDTTIANYDFTSECVYLVANGYLYIINTNTGEDTIERKYVGEKIDVRKIADGIVLFGEGTSEAIMKTDNKGEILWTVNPKKPVRYIEQVQFVDDKMIVCFDEYDANAEMDLDSCMSEFMMIDIESGELLKEVESAMW